MLHSATSCSDARALPAMPVTDPSSLHHSTAIDWLVTKRSATDQLTYHRSPSTFSPRDTLRTDPDVTVDPDAPHSMERQYNCIAGCG